MLSLNRRAASLGTDVAQALVTDESQPKSPVSQSVSPPIIEKPVEKIAPRVERVEEPKKEKPLPISHEDSKAQELIVKPAPVVEKKAEKQKKSAPKFTFHSLGFQGFAVLGSILAVFFLILGMYGLAHLPTMPKPSPTAQVTSTFELPTATELLTATFQPPTETSTATLLPIPTLGIGSSMISEKDDMTLLYVPAGSFTMGSDNGNTNESPAHQVYQDAFWIDRTDVTNAMYAKCVADKGACSQPTNLSSYTRSSYYDNSQFDNYPVIYVNWNMADTYCKWAGRQLPTEAQWEKAARGSDGRTYPWGNNAPDNTLLNYNSSLGDTTTVGSYPKGASPYGALDMAGNVWQWVADWYQSGYYATLGNNASNPQGPASGDGRVLRGGSWDGNLDDVRSAYRNWSDPTITFDSIGFRCSRSLP